MKIFITFSIFLNKVTNQPEAIEIHPVILVYFCSPNKGNQGPVCTSFSYTFKQAEEHGTIN
jgi:hypothetical protein